MNITVANPLPQSTKWILLFKNMSRRINIDEEYLFRNISRGALSPFSTTPDTT